MYYGTPLPDKETSLLLLQTPKDHIGVDLANYVPCVETYVTVSGSKLRKYDYISCIKVEMEKRMSNYEEISLRPNGYASFVTVTVSLNQTDTDRMTCMCAPQMDPKEYYHKYSFTVLSLKV
jgi:hypothetical protein